MRKHTYVKGTHNAICQICGFKYKRSEMRKTWDNLVVCQTDYDVKHPQLIVKPRYDNQSIKDARPRVTESVELANDPLQESQMI